jgi:hypothetical protein
MNNLSTYFLFRAITLPPLASFLTYVCIEHGFVFNLKGLDLIFFGGLFFVFAICISTANTIGGVDNLIEWARCNQTEFYKMLARLMPREIHADVNAGTSLVELLQEIDEREAKAKE